MNIKKVVVCAGASALAFSFVGFVSGNTNDSVANTLPQVQVAKASSSDLSSLQPKEVAAAVLSIGAEDNQAWQSMKDSFSNGDSDMEVNLVDEDVDSLVTQPGTGMFYDFTLDGNMGGMINGYTLSQDGSTIYLYSEEEHDSAERTITPFKTISASQVVKAAHASDVQDIASNASIDQDD